MKNADFNDVVRNYLRPWKLFTLVVGFTFLFWGAYNRLAPDWDFGISIIMGLLTYLTAPWSARVIVNREWNKMFLALFFYLLSVDFAYWGYWTLIDKTALIMRPANFLASTCLYWLCGFIWLHNGTLKQILTSKLDSKID